MDKAEIRATAATINGSIPHIEAALTAACETGWNEGVEAAAGTAREILSLSRNLTASELEAEVIRRLKNGQE